MVRVEFGILRLNHHYLQAFHIWLIFFPQNFRLKTHPVELQNSWPEIRGSFEYHGHGHSAMEPWGGYWKGGVLGGSFFHGDLVVATQRFIIFTPKIGEDEPNLTSIFFKGVGTNHQPDSVILWDLSFKMFFIISEGRKTHYSYRWYTQDRGESSD